MLTTRQHGLLSYIADTIAVTGSAPSYDEMRAAMRLHSKSGIHRLVTALEERGFIARHARRARAIEVLRGVPGRAVPSSVPVVRGSSVPLFGCVAAGAPLEAVPEHARRVEVPAGMLGPGDHYALCVIGDSMTGDCIMDGDTAVVRRCQEVAEGRIAVVLVAGADVALKRVRLRGPMAVLESSNPAYPPRAVAAASVRVQGALVGILRSY